MKGHSGKLERERRTIRAMIALYCRGHHRDRGLCEACAGLQAYADARLDRCPYGPSKPTCLSCPVHCYKPAMREKVREVMRYAGPRMLRRHPILAVRHVLDGSRVVAARPPRGRGGDPAPAGAGETARRATR